ncbi:MAG: hypothetical protein AB1631_13010 [Acidobacteriota bacterium]
MSKQPPRPKSTEEILREMESMSKGIGQTEAASEEPAKKEGGALKSLLGFFVKVVPEEEEAPAPRPSAPSPAQRPSTAQSAMPRTGPRVADLVAGEPAPKFKASVSETGDLSQKPFEQIYREAGIANSPCTVDELETLMANPAVANQPMSVKIIAVNLALSSKGIGADVPVADAVRRDRALDAYQGMLDEKASETEDRNLTKIKQITLETEEYLKRRQAEIEALRSETSEAKRQSIDFSLRREAEEKRLANLISPFLEGKPNPVTVGEKTEEPSGGSQ